MKASFYHTICDQTASDKDHCDYIFDMLVSTFYKRLDEWRQSNPITARLQSSAKHEHQANEYALDLLANGGEIALRNGNVGLYFGIGKIFYDVFRRTDSVSAVSRMRVNHAHSGETTMAVEGAVFFLGTSQGPDNYAHGGAVAHVLDDFCGLAFGAGCFKQRHSALILHLK